MIILFIHLPSRSHTQVRLLLLPTKKIKFKTKVKQGESPQFMETFHFKISAGTDRPLDKLPGALPCTVEPLFTKK